MGVHVNDSSRKKLIGSRDFGTERAAKNAHSDDSH